MTTVLEKGALLGRFEVMGLLGAGAMGTVYRARDPQLGREVAIKVLPAEVSRDREALERFGQEARTASALNHPNIVTVYETGADGPTPFIAMELVEGRTLREILESGPLPLRKLLDLASQIADGLAAAHEKGLVHRDLKPQNIMVTKGGHSKILDFGLAKLVRAASTDPTSLTQPYVHELTIPGTILGTAGYMSPEQAKGQPADFRADQFALGIILYEALSGRRAFDRDSAAETLAAIIREEPPPLPPLDPRADIPLRWILERCLSKEADERYAATRDLARELAHLRDGLAAGPNSAGETRRRWRTRIAAGAALVAVLAGGAGILANRRLSQRPPPSFHQLTFRRGTIWSARFSADGRTVLYAAAWDGAPFRLFRTHPEGPESVALPFPDGNLLALSRTGTVAAALRCRAVPPGGVTVGMLAEAPLAGGVPREVQEDVLFADFSPDGRERATVRSAGGRSILEFPAGTKLYETAGYLSNARVSPRGDLVAFLDHPGQVDDRGVVRVVDRAGHARAVSPEWSSAQGLAWHPSGKEIWFAATDGRDGRAVWAADLKGKVRVVTRSTGDLTLHDVFEGGRALVTRDTRRLGILARGPGDTHERDLSWLDSSLVTAISADGRALLFTEFGVGVDGDYEAFLRARDGAAPMRLGEGFAQSLSPDGKYALAILVSSPQQVLLLPTGAAAPRRFAVPGLAAYQWVSFLPDGKRFVIAGAEPGHGVRLYVRDLDGTRLRPITPEGLVLRHYQGFPVSPDGRWVVGNAEDGPLTLYSTDSLDARAVPGVPPGTVPVDWSADGKTLFVCENTRVPVPVYRLDPFTGNTSLWKELVPSDPAGVIGVASVHVTPDGGTYAYSYARFLSELYLVEGLK